MVQIGLECEIHLSYPKTMKRDKSYGANIPIDTEEYSAGILEKHKLILKPQQVFGVTGATFHRNIEDFIKEMNTLMVEKLIHIEFSPDDCGGGLQFQF